MEDGIPGRLQHRHETCCEKGGRHGRRACRVQRWHHHGDVVFQTGGLVYNILQGCNFQMYGLAYDIPLSYLLKELRKMQRKAAI